MIASCLAVEGLRGCPPHSAAGVWEYIPFPSDLVAACHCNLRLLALASARSCTRVCLSRYEAGV
jgi:hypothetical protein